jgi:hypothetical protein
VSTISVVLIKSQNDFGFLGIPVVNSQIWGCKMRMHAHTPKSGALHSKSLGFGHEFGHFTKVSPNVTARSVFCDDALGAPVGVTSLSPRFEIASQPEKAPAAPKTSSFRRMSDLLSEPH